jgi:anti-sigma28 factor (negative regulator of flagellin synthesis)
MRIKSFIQRLWGPVLDFDPDTSSVAAGQSDEPPLLQDPPSAQLDEAVFEETPEARVERVAELRHQVQEGMYEIPMAELVRILTYLILGRHQ